MLTLTLLFSLLHRVNFVRQKKEVPFPFQQSGKTFPSHLKKRGTIPFLPYERESRADPEQTFPTFFSWKQKPPLPIFKKTRETFLSLLFGHTGRAPVASSKESKIETFPSSFKKERQLPVSPLNKTFPSIVQNRENTAPFHPHPFSSSPSSSHPIFGQGKESFSCDFPSFLVEKRRRDGFRFMEYFHQFNCLFFVQKFIDFFCESCQAGPLDSFFSNNFREFCGHTRVCWRNLLVATRDVSCWALVTFVTSSVEFTRVFFLDTAGVVFPLLW